MLAALTCIGTTLMASCVAIMMTGNSGVVSMTAEGSGVTYVAAGVSGVAFMKGDPHSSREKSIYCSRVQLGPPTGISWPMSSSSLKTFY